MPQSSLDSQAKAAEFGKALVDQRMDPDSERTLKQLVEELRQKLQQTPMVVEGVVSFDEIFRMTLESAMLITVRRSTHRATSAILRGRNRVRPRLLWRRLVEIALLLQLHGWLDMELQRQREGIPT